MKATPTYKLNSTNGRFSIAKMIGAAIRTADLFSSSFVDTLLGDLFLTPRRIAAPKREMEWLASAARFDCVTGRGQRVAFYVWGESIRGTVLLVHGWEGRASQMGAIALELAESGYRVISIDLPGHGASAGRRTNVVECGDVVDDFGRRFGPFKAIVAHSFGCAAVTAAIRRGLKTDDLFFISPANDYRHFGEFFGSMLGLRSGTAERIRQEIESRLGVAWAELQPDRVGPSSEIPLLVIHDEHDREIPVEQGEKVAAVWNDASVITTRRLGHRRILRDDRAVRTIVSRLVGPTDYALAV